MLVRFTRLAAALALAAAHMAAGAQTTGQDLAKARNCMGCHRVDSRLVGPSYLSVAQRHAGESDAVEKLAHSIRRGSVKKWGAIPMPAQTAVSDDEARQLAQWVLSLKKQ